MREYKAPRGYTKVVDGEYPQIDDGASVYITPMYVREDESPKKWFVCELSKGFCLIADNKKELNNNEGRIYSIWSIAYYKNF